MMKFGIIGCGKRGFSLLACLKTLKEEVAAICDIDEDSLHNFSNMIDNDVLTTKDYKEVNRSDVDAVIISTHTQSHVEIALDALENKKHIILEKPVGVNLEEVDYLIRLSKRYESVIDIAMPIPHSYIYNNLLHHIKYDLEGTKYVVINEHRQNFLLPWYYDKKKSGGAINDKMIHYFDIAHHFIRGMPVRVFATGSKHVNDKDFKITGMLGEKYNIKTSGILDNAFIIVDYENKARALFTLNMYQQKPIEGLHLSITGNNGQHLTAHDFTHITGHYSLVKDNQTIKLRITDKTDNDKYLGSHPGSLIQIKEFIAAVRDNKMTKTNIYRARKSHIITEASLESIRTGKPVFLKKYHDNTEWLFDTPEKNDVKIISKTKSTYFGKRRPARYVARFFLRRKINKAMRKINRAQVLPKDMDAVLHVNLPVKLLKFSINKGIISHTNKRDYDVKISITEQGWADLMKGTGILDLQSKNQLIITGDTDLLKKYLFLMDKIWKSLS